MFVKHESNGERSSVGRAPVCGTGCRGFEPHRSPQFFIRCSVQTPFFYVFRQVGLKVQSVRQQKRPGEVFVSGNEALLTSDATAARRESFTRRIPEHKNSSGVVSVTGGVKGLLRRGGAGGPTWLQNFQLLCGSGG